MEAFPQGNNDFCEASWNDSTGSSSTPKFGQVDCDPFKSAQQEIDIDIVLMGTEAVLKQFKQDSGRTPSKDNTRKKFIRIHQHFIRALQSDYFGDPKKTEAPLIIPTLDDLEKHIAYCRHPDSQLLSSSEVTCYIKDFYKRYLSCFYVRQSYILYMDTIFNDRDPATLCSEFRIKCCRYKEHTHKCSEKWGQLRYQAVTLFAGEKGEFCSSPDKCISEG